MDIGTVAIVAQAIVAVVAIAGLLLTYFKEMGDLKQRVTSVETKIEPFWDSIRTNVADLLKGSGTGNPVPKEERDRLLEKLKAGTLAPGEARRLEGILQEELQEAKSRGDTAVMIAILLGLALLAALLSKRT